MQPKNITTRQHDRIKALALFVPKDALQQHITTACNNRVAALEDLTREEAFNLLKIIANRSIPSVQPEIAIQDLTMATTDKSNCTTGAMYRESG